MTGKRGKGAGSGGGNEDFPETEHFIEFTPDGGFDIRSAAKNLVKLMNDLEQDLVMHLPHVTVEFQYGCTVQEVIDGYNLATAQKMIIEHANCNDSGKPSKGGKSGPRGNKPKR